MIVRIAKVELKQRSKDNGFLQVHIKCGSVQVSTQNPRKIKQRVANFFNQPIQVILEQHKFSICLHYSNSNSQYKLLAQFGVSETQFERLYKKQKYYCNMVNQNKQLKIYWCWQIENSDNIAFSEFTHDLLNIETPKKVNILDPQDITAEDDIFGTKFRTYSPLGRKRSQVILGLDYLKSENGECSFGERTKNTKNYNNNNNHCSKQCDNKIKSIKISKSADTRSKTNSQQKIGINSPMIKYRSIQKIRIQNVNQDYGKTVQKKQHLQKLQMAQRQKRQKSNSFRTTRASSQRRNTFNSNINRVGAMVASTVGIFAGLFAGYVSSAI